MSTNQPCRYCKHFEMDSGCQDFDLAFQSGACLIKLGSKVELRTEAGGHVYSVDVDADFGCRAWEQK